MLGDSPRLLSPQAEITIRQPAPRRLLARRRLAPGVGFENFHAKGQLEWVNRTVAFQKATRADGRQRGHGHVVRELQRTAAGDRRHARPQDVRPLEVFRRDQCASRQAPPSESLLSLVREADGLQFPLIQDVDADLRISSDSVVVPGVTIGHSAATISLKGGKMLADIAELEIDDGTKGGGQLRIDATGPRPATTCMASSRRWTSAAPAQAIFGHPTVQGRGDITVDISAAGDTGDSLLGSLDGKMCVTLSEGGLLGIDVNKLVAAANTPQAASVWQAASTGAIAIDKLDARFARGERRRSAPRAPRRCRAIAR